jgi:broad specificity phosphatase PhoE
MPELVLVRHGETVGQSSIRLYGATDVALAHEGEQQAAAAGRSLAGQRFDAVLTSPLQRARRSAEIVLVAGEHPAIEVEVIEDFREVNFGDWEGWTWADVQARDPEAHARWSSEGPQFRFPGGEVRHEFLARVQSAVEPRILDRFAAGATRMLAVLHMGVIRAIVARLLEVPITELEGLALPLGTVRRLHFADSRWTLAPDPDDRVEPVLNEH